MTGMASQRVAVVGVGIMGSAIARRLLDCGHCVTGFDPDRAKLAGLAAAGALAATSTARATAESELVITSLNSAAIAQGAVFGGAGVAEGAEPADGSRLLIDMSSITPPATRDFATALRERCSMGWVDAPQSGGAPKALPRQLTVMAGGSENDVNRARRVMDSLCANYTHMARRAPARPPSW